MTTDRGADGAPEEPTERSTDSGGGSAPTNSTTADGDDASEPVPEPGSAPVVAGHIDREHAAFVVLGALTTVLVLLRTTGL